MHVNTVAGAITTKAGLAMEQCEDLLEDESAAVSGHHPIGDCSPKTAFDRIVKLAADLFEAPIAAIILPVDGDVQCTAYIGTSDTERLGKSSLCADIIGHGEVLVVEDISASQRFRNDPVVVSAPHLCFFAGVPLITGKGEPIGALVIADTQTRKTLSATEIEKLEGLAALTINVLSASEYSRESGHSTLQSAAFLASMSHDIRTPMNGVLGMAELLLTADDLSDRHRRRVEIIKRSGKTLLTMLDHLIELSKIDTEGSVFESSPLDLRELLLDVYSQFQSMDLGKIIEYDLVDALDEHYRVYGNVERLRRLFSTFVQSAANVSTGPSLNIVVRAQPAPSERLQIRFAIELTAVDAEPLSVHLASLERGDHVGADSFEIVRNLMICRNLADLIGGNIRVDNCNSEMSSFRVDFTLDPASAANAATSAPEDRQEPYPPIEPPSHAEATRDVLVAEDDPDMALLIEDLLDEAGYRATVAFDGASALDFINRQSFDVVLMDGRLPDMTGFDAANAIRNLPDERARTPIIALTGEALSGDRERYLSAGMDDYIAKPVSYATLVSTIERCFDKRNCGIGRVDGSSSRH